MECTRKGVAAMNHVRRLLDEYTETVEVSKHAEAAHILQRIESVVNIVGQKAAESLTNYSNSSLEESGAAAVACNTLSVEHTRLIRLLRHHTDRIQMKLGDECGILHLSQQQTIQEMLEEQTQAAAALPSQ
ncbi:MAG: hypothetical protein WCV62_03425 [Candidatus Peribacteraceae bacterium]|jgi:hypothetical protein